MWLFKNQVLNLFELRLQKIIKSSFSDIYNLQKKKNKWRFCNEILDCEINKKYRFIVNRNS